MKFTVALIATALLAFALCLYLPWWGIAIAAFVVAAAIPQRPLRAFTAAFSALFLLWGGLSFWLSSANGHVLAHKVSVVILKMDNPWLLMMATALIGALVAGVSALPGSFLRQSSRVEE